MKAISCSVLLALSLFAWIPCSEATFYPGWTFDLDALSAQPNQVIYLSSTLYNNSDNGELWSSGIITSYGTIPSEYIYDPVPTPIPFEIPAGGSSGPYPIGTLTPSVVSGVPAGVYQLPDMSLKFESGLVLPEGGNGLAVAVVPEPTTLLLFGIGFLGLIVFSRRRSN